MCKALLLLMQGMQAMPGSFAALLADQDPLPSMSAQVQTLGGTQNILAMNAECHSPAEAMQGWLSAQEKQPPAVLRAAPGQIVKACSSPQEAALAKPNLLLPPRYWAFAPATTNKLATSMPTSLPCIVP